MITLIRQSFASGIYCEDKYNAIVLEDEDIARIIRLRFLLSYFDYSDLVQALTLFVEKTGVTQSSSLEEITREVNQ